MEEFKNKISRISDILEQRHKDWPYRKKASRDFRKETGNFYIQIKKSSEFNKFIIDNNEINKFNNQKINPVFICGNMKSGTSLLGQLLDNHPDLFVFPGDSHFFKLFAKNSGLSFDQTAEWWLRKAINPTGQKPSFPFGKNPNSYIKFSKLLNAFYDPENPLHAIIKSFILSFGNKEKTYRYWVEKTPGNEFYYEKIMKFYPKAKFIHIYRNPFGNIASLQKLEKVRHRKTSLIQKTLFYRASYEKGLRNSKKNKNYFMLKYEDLINSPESELKQICDFLKTDFHSTLLNPSVNGISAEANSMIPEKRVDGKILNKIDYPEDIKKFDKKSQKKIYSITISVLKNYKFDENTKSYLKNFEKTVSITFYYIIYEFYKLYRNLFFKNK